MVASIDTLNDTPIVRLHEKQVDFVYSNTRFTGYVGGRGSGKSLGGAYRLLRKARGGRLYLVAAPTYGMLHDGTVRTFEGLATYTGYLKKINRGRGNGSALIYTDDDGEAEILFRSASDPDKFRGPNYSGAWFDEASYMKPEALDVALACLREKGEAGWLSSTFTPNGKTHWTYDVFKKKSMGVADLIHSTSKENPFVHEDYTGPMEMRYSDAIRRQELDGEFIDSIGMLLTYEQILECMDDRAGLNSGPIRGPLYIGYDVGATQNLSVIWTWESIVDPGTSTPLLFCRECLVMKDIPLEEQQSQIAMRVQNDLVVRCAIDAGTIAAQMVQNLKDWFFDKIIPVHFTQQQMGGMAMALANSIKLGGVRIPSGEEVFKDFLLVENPTRKNGKWVLSADQVHEDENKVHADRFWAASLGLFAYANDPMNRYVEMPHARPSGRRL